MDKLVAVIVPVYNAEQYLEKCIESILSENKVPIEIVLVDDGATDSYGRICDAFAAKDARALNKAAAAVLLMSSGTLNELSPVVSAATKEDKPLIPVYLDRVELPAGMRMLLGPKQAHARQNYTDDAGFAEALLASPVLRELRVTPAQKKAARGLLIGDVLLQSSDLVIVVVDASLQTLDGCIQVLDLKWELTTQDFDTVHLREDLLQVVQRLQALLNGQFMISFCHK